MSHEKKKKKNGLKIQINDCDTYQHAPTKLDRLCNKVGKVPVVRIYGTLLVLKELDGLDGLGGLPGLLGLSGHPGHLGHLGNSGQNFDCKLEYYNIMVHVHNYFPYFYVDFGLTDLKGVSKAHLDEVATYLERSLLESYRRRKPIEEEEREDVENFDEDTMDIRRFVAKVEICRATPIYGFHSNEQLFYKVYLLSPRHKARLAGLFQDHKIDISSLYKNRPQLKQKQINIYEAHIPFTLQFMVDFNLYGCSWLDLSSAYFRTPVASSFALPYTDGFKQYLNGLFGCNKLLSSKSYPRMGKSHLEIDTSIENILNRNLLQETTANVDLWSSCFQNVEEPGKEKLLFSLNHIYQDLKFYCHSRNVPFSETRLPLGSSKESKTSWHNQKDLDELLKYVVHLNKNDSPSNPVDRFLNGTSTVNKLHSIPTAFRIIDKDVKELLRKPVRFNSLELHSGDPLDSGFEVSSNESTKATVSSPKNGSLRKQIEKASILHLPSSDTLKSDDPISDSPSEVSDAGEDEVNRSKKYSPSFDEMMLDLSQKNNTKRSFSQMTLTRDSQSESSNSRVFSDNEKNCIAPKNDCIVFSSSCNVFEITTPNELKKSNVMGSLEDSGQLKVIYPDPFYDKRTKQTKPNDRFSKGKAGIKFNDIPRFRFHNQGEHFSISGTIKDTMTASSSRIRLFRPKQVCRWKYCPSPPLKSEVCRIIQEEKAMKLKRLKKNSQIESVTQSNDFKYSYKSEKVKRRPDLSPMLTSLYLEVHVNRIEEFLPDPSKDAINIIAYHFDDLNQMYIPNSPKSGFLVYEKSSKSIRSILNKVAVFLSPKPCIEVFDDELEMFNRLIEMVGFFDPDILCGYEVNASSWGYIIERANSNFNLNILALLSRSLVANSGKLGDKWGYTHTSSYQINGRHILNIWRSLRHDLSLTNYSLENVCYHLLHQSVPVHLIYKLSEWYMGAKFLKLLLVFRYYSRRLQLLKKIVDVQEYIVKNVEQSRIIGIDFNANLYRGSQYKVESILARLTKLRNVLLNSISKQEVHGMRALDCIPLVMEPESNYYKSPLLVFDFQSLYPSVMIAYNYCYSTILGKLHGFNPKKNAIGYLKHLSLPHGIMEKLVNLNALTISPNGYIFVKSFIRKSVLALMLEEILNSRFTVKAMMSQFKDDRELWKINYSRQLALKLIANVTYGYTSATFSGRMPNADIADSIVATGREILTQSIELIELKVGGAKVVYGDTDSLFVYLPGKSKKEAFMVGHQIAEDITNAFPDPIKLKFEKVYHPAILLAKKRYVGFSYENEKQSEPFFDAKGIETIRRDGIPAQLKILEKSLNILFKTQNLSQVEEYVTSQFYKIIFNKVPIQDFCFAKEVRYGTYKHEMYLPPGAIVAGKNVENDPRSEPQYRERVPYLIYLDSSKKRLKDRCVSPEEFIGSFNTVNPMQLDYTYYITKVLIPPLERVFNLIDVDVRSWYEKLPKMTSIMSKKGSITNYSNVISSNACLVCSCQLDDTGSELVCNLCMKNELQVISTVFQGIRTNATKLSQLAQTCKLCVHGNLGNVSDVTQTAIACCTNRNCTIYYRKIKTESQEKQMRPRRAAILKELE